MIDLVALRSLCSVAKHGTLARAASELSFTPSGVSQQIGRLEAQLGTRLLSPAGRGVVLTPAARYLVDEAPTVFAALERCTAGVRALDSREPAGVVRIAAFSTAIRGLVAPALPSLLQRYVGLSVKVFELDPGPASRAVEVGEADLALIHDADGIMPPFPSGVVTRTVTIDKGDLVVRQDHPLASHHGPLTRKALAGLRWACSPVGTVCHLWFQRAVAGVDDHPEITHSSDDFSTQLALVDADNVVALIPRLARPTLPDSVVAVSLADPPRRTVVAMWRDAWGDDPALTATLAALGMSD